MWSKSLQIVLKNEKHEKKVMCKNHMRKQTNKQTNNKLIGENTQISSNEQTNN